MPIRKLLRDNEKENGRGVPQQKERSGVTRRGILKMLTPAAFMLATPSWAVDLFKIIDPKGESEDVQRAKQILQGAGNILTSATGLDYDSERTIGESLALEGFKRYGMPVKNEALQRYIALVGRTVVRNSIRTEIPYHFVLIDSPLYNAFACPGGIVFVSAALFKGMRDEAELAGVLAHEVAHVGHKHALQSIRRARFFEGVGKISTANMKGADGRKFREMIGGLQTVLFDKGLDQNMEFEADASALAFAYRTGYDPNGFVRVLKMLHKREAGAVKKGSWFSTHPPLMDRINRCSGKMKAYPDSKNLALARKRFETYRAMI